MRSVVRVHLSPLISLKIMEYGGLAQLGERLPCKQEVTSSNLVFSTVLTLHLENDVLSVACRHAIKQNILKLMEASFQRIKYLFCNVP